MKIIHSLFLTMLMGAAILLANDELKVTDMHFCIAVEASQPVGVDSAFSNTMERIYCYSKISGAAAETKITHVWYHENEERARVSLDVKASSWRTWSSKKMIPEWYGNWRVDIIDVDENVLSSATFTLAKDTE